MTVEHGDVLRVSTNFHLGDGTLCQNVYHYLFDGVGIIADATVAADIGTQMNLMYDELGPQCRNDILGDLSSVDKVVFVGGQWTVSAHVGTFTVAFAGTGGGIGLPYQVSPFVTFKTARPKSVGRKFLFPFVSSSQAETILAVAAVDDIVLYAAEALEDITIAVVNALHPGVPRTGVDDWLSFTVAVVTNLLGSQKRRRPGVGA